MKFLKRKRNIVILVISLVVVIGVVAAVLLLTSHQVLEKSTAILKIKDEEINLSFQITPQDQVIQSQFASNLGVGDDWSKGFSFSLDQPTIALLKDSLPQRLFLDFSPKRIHFSSQRIPLLTSALVGKDYDFASGSAKLHLKAVNSSDYSLEVTDPQDLMRFATSSGQLYLSPELKELFPLINKVATMKIESNGGNTQGEILLK